MKISIGKSFGWLSILLLVSCDTSGSTTFNKAQVAEQSTSDVLPDNLPVFRVDWKICGAEGNANDCTQNGAATYLWGPVGEAKLVPVKQLSALSGTLEHRLGIESRGCFPASLQPKERGLYSADLVLFVNRKKMPTVEITRKVQVPNEQLTKIVSSQSSIRTFGTSCSVMKPN